MGNNTTGLETYVRGSGWVPLALLIAGLAACQQTGPRRATPADGGPALQALPLGPAPVTPFHGVSAPFDLGRVMRQVHLAFRPAEEQEEQKGAFVGGDATYGVRVDPAGRIRLTPVHHLHPGAPLTGATIWLQTVAIWRGGELLDAPVQRRRLRPDGRLALDRGPTVEELANTEEGLEQSWRFRRPPSGRGDIVVGVAIGGQRYRGSTGHGLHFVDERTGVGVRYGRATWVDARGRRTELQGSYANGQVQLRVPATVVASSAYPAVLDPVIAPEFGMDKPAYGPPVAEQQEPAVAFDGTNYFVVWQDKREGSTWDVLGARVNATGTVLDTQGITISKANSTQSTPAVAFGGGHYLVAWQDNRNGNWDVYGARVKASDATVQEAAGIAISTGTGDQSAPAVTFDGTNYFVVWQDNRNGNWDIYGARLSTAGIVLDTTGLTLSPAVNSQQAPAVAFDGTNYLVVWQDYRSLTDWDVYAARVTTAGSLLDSSGIPVASVTNNQQSPAVAFDGTNYLVVWQDNRNPGTKWDIFGSRVGKGGSVLDPFGIPVSKYDNDQQDQQLPALAFDGTNYLVAWQDNRNALTTKWDIYGARVSTAGAVVDTGGNPFLVISEQPGSQQHPSVVVGASGLLVTWSDFRTESANLNSSSGWDIYGTPVSAAGVVASAAGIGIATDLNAQEVPALAFDGTNYLVVWSDYRTGTNGPGWDIYGTRVTTTGTVLDSSGLAISTALNDQKEPAVIFGGTQYLVVWEDKRDATSWDIYGARLTTAGAVLESAGLVVSQETGDQRSPDVAHDGTNFLVVWEDRRIGNQLDIYGARVDATGTVVDSAGIAISSASSDQQHPAVAHDGTNFLVVWEDKRAGPNWDIYGARLNGAGSLLDPQGNVISIGANDQQRPAVVYDGTQNLVVWEDKRNGTHWDIYGARINAQGLPQEFNGIAISGAAEDQQFPTAGHDGFNTVVAWQDMRNGNRDIYGARITSAGVVADTQGFAISAGTTDESRPALLGDGDGKVLVTYHRLSTTTIYGTNRVQGRMVITHAPNSSPCSAAIDCKSGHCVDAVCCDTACGGGISTDCQACSVTAGAAADGTCGVVAAGTACRPVAGDCDLAETCDGSSLVCPTDLFEPATKVCRPADGDCDAAESCNGTGAACPADAVLPASTVCRPPAGDCDLAESCDGIGTVCPQDLFKPDGTACATGTCQSGTCVAPPDGGPAEGGPTEGGPTEGGPAEGGPTEGGPTEGGPADAGAPDGAPAEVGAGDLGPSQDASSDSAVARPDSSYCFGPQCSEPGGCGCSVASRPGGLGLRLFALVVLLLLGVRLRRSTFPRATVVVAGLVLLCGGCATTTTKKVDYGPALARAKQSCARLDATKLPTPIQTKVERRMAAIRRARADGKEAEAFGRADRLAVDCAREAQIRKDLQVISMDVDRNKDRLPSDAAARFYELLRTGDYSNALLCGEALLRGAAERCAFASGHGTVATGDADEELWTAPEEDTDPGPPVRSNRLILSVGFGVGSANLSGVHDGAADVATAFETQNPGLSLDGEPQSSLQINWGIEARYYLPYHLFAQLGFGSLYNRAASDFGSGTLTNENWALELPILVGFYYLMKEHFCLFGALGPSVLLWSRSIWSSDPGGAPDFKSDAAVGAHFLAGLDYVFNDRWALGIDLRYRLLRAGELKNVKTDEPLRSGQLLGDPTRRTYDLDFSGLSGTFSMRVFVL